MSETEKAYRVEGIMISSPGDPRWGKDIGNTSKALWEAVTALVATEMDDPSLVPCI